MVLAALDDFMLKLLITYPSKIEERQILDRMAFTTQPGRVGAVIRSRRAGLAVFVAGGLLLSACGSSGDGTAASGAEAERGKRGGKLR